MSNILYQSDYALLTYYKADKILKLEWLKSCTEEEYRTTFLELLNQSYENKILYFLSDIRHEGAVTYTNLMWMKKEVIPRAVEIGIKKVGLILDGDFFSKLYADSVRTGLEESDIPINYFKNDVEAISWFKTD